MATVGNAKVAKLIRDYVHDRARNHKPMMTLESYIRIRYPDPTGELVVHRVMSGITTEP